MLHSTSSPSPAVPYLGLTLNLIDDDKVNIHSVADSLKSWGNRRAVALDETSPRSWPLSDGEIFSVPGNVIIREIGASTGDLVIFKSGSDVKTALEQDASFSASYLGFSSSGSVSRTSNSEYKDDKSYAFYSSIQQGYDADLDVEYCAKALDPALLSDIKLLPVWDPQNDATYSTYRAFITKWGSHVITSTRQGCRYQLQVDDSNVTSSAASSFAANVTAEYSGIGSIKGSASQKNSDDYKSYTTRSHTLCTILGGDLAKRQKLYGAPGDPALYQIWAESTSLGTSQLISAQLTDFPTILQFSSDKSVQAIGVEMAVAWEYFAQPTFEFWVMLSAYKVPPSESATATLAPLHPTDPRIRVESYDTYGAAPTLLPLTHNPLTFGWTDWTEPSAVPMVFLKVISGASLQGSVLQQTAGEHDVECFILRQDPHIAWWNGGQQAYNVVQTSAAKPLVRWENDNVFERNYPIIVNDPDQTVHGTRSPKIWHGFEPRVEEAQYDETGIEVEMVEVLES